MHIQAILLSAFLSGTTAQQYQQPPPSYGYAPAAPQPAGYGYAPAAPQPAGYGYAPAAPQPAGYGYAPAAPQPAGYGYAPAAPQPAGYGYAPAPAGYATPAPTYYSTPAPTVSAVQSDFQLFWDNQLLCNAEYSLQSCLIQATSRESCFSQQNIITCTTAFVEGLCTGLANTATQSCDNGLVHLNEQNCADAAFADSLLVYNKILREVNTALAVTPSFDEWTFTTIKIALAATRNHADCVIFSFFNYLNSCAANSILTTADITCLEDALQNGKCQFAEEVADGWNLPAFLAKYGNLALGSILNQLQSSYGTTHDYELNRAVTDLLQAVSDESTEDVEYMSTTYDYHESVTTVDVCTFPSISNLLQLSVPSYPQFDINGNSPSNIAFHLPLNFTNGFISVVEPTTNYGPTGIYQTCSNYYATTQSAYKSNSTTNAGDMCYSISGYYIEFLETGEVKPLTFTQGSFIDEVLPICQSASWDEAQSCNSHLTQWQMVVACCKSYATVLAEAQAAWTTTYGNAPGGGYGYVSPPAKPTSVPSSFETNECMYEQVYTSDSVSSPIYSADLFLGVWPSTTTNSIQTIDQDLDEYLSYYRARCSLYNGKFPNNYEQGFCQTVAAPSLNITLAAQDSTFYSGCQSSRYYLDQSPTSQNICGYLQLDLNMSQIVPLVGSECFPQACILSQLSNCMDIPAPAPAQCGFSYVIQPSAGYAGYSSQSTQYHNMFLASSVPESSVMFLGGAGFIAGLVVIAVAQFLVKNRRGQATPAQYVLI